MLRPDLTVTECPPVGGYILSTLIQEDDMKRFAIAALALVATASLADACPLAKRVKARVQARPMVRYYAAPVKATVQAVVQSRPVATFFAPMTCGQRGCK